MSKLMILIQTLKVSSIAAGKLIKEKKWFLVLILTDKVNNTYHRELHHSDLRLIFLCETKEYIIEICFRL